MCTTLMFKTGSGITVAHNLDSLFLTYGLFFTNQRGLAKTAMIFPRIPQPSGLPNTVVSLTTMLVKNFPPEA